MDQDAMYIDIGRANYTRKDLLVDEGGSGEEDRAGGTDDNDDNDDDEDSEVNTIINIVYTYRTYRELQGYT